MPYFREKRYFNAMIGHGVRYLVQNRGEELHSHQIKEPVSVPFEFTLIISHLTNYMSAMLISCHQVLGTSNIAGMELLPIHETLHRVLL